MTINEKKPIINPSTMGRETRSDKVRAPVGGTTIKEKNSWPRYRDGSRMIFQIFLKNFYFKKCGKIF